MDSYLAKYEKCQNDVIIPVSKRLRSNSQNPYNNGNKPNHFLQCFKESTHYKQTQPGIKLYSSPHLFKATNPKDVNTKALANEPSRNPGGLEVEGVYNRNVHSVLRLHFSADLITASLS
ncbi:hypothetical protein CDAR_179131 [Caerostris darwini]|uniref:Uncharacterized protein n=1 Tax=Caerostris darwini TaxID=1538125 RepID=A0AAV4PBN6_9ARAC|nr:hypothetical protein CDAR_179131 [Caerostris darwini]